MSLQIVYQSAAALIKSTFYFVVHFHSTPSNELSYLFTWLEAEESNEKEEKKGKNKEYLITKMAECARVCGFDSFTRFNFFSAIIKFISWYQNARLSVECSQSNKTNS